jgi:AAA+ ATPase superfamily predicted ATPase
MKSPFQYGTLVDKESFVNRVEERKQLKELLGSGINVMLISPRRWGKSSLVKVAMDELTQEDKHIRVCFIDAFSIKTEAEFYRIFAREVISCAASTLEKRLEDVKQFLKAVSPSITLKSDPTDTLSFDLKLEPDSTILMCSDGLSNMVEDSKLEEIILDQTEELPKKGEKLLKEANQNGGKDNIAVILVEPFTNEVEKC